MARTIEVSTYHTNPVNTRSMSFEDKYIPFSGVYFDLTQEGVCDLPILVRLENMYKYYYETDELPQPKANPTQEKSG